MVYPDDLKYTEDHSWIRLEDKVVVQMGITDYGQDSMGEITYVEYPQVGVEIERGERLVSIGSSKAFVELPSPVSGTVLEVNESLEVQPTLVNEDPYGKGWMVRMGMRVPSELAMLMDSAAYIEFIQKQG